MKIYSNQFSIHSFPEFTQNFLTEDMLLFDIETTGLSSARDQIYCIGCGFRKNHDIQIQLFFAENISDEPKILEKFFQLLEKHKTILTFNGSTFDIPFIRKRTQIYNETLSKAVFSSMDNTNQEFSDSVSFKNSIKNDTYPQRKLLFPDLKFNTSIDLFREIKKMHHLLELPAYKQKNVEQFLGCDREDQYNGGQLIEIYHKYVLHPDPDLLHLLLIHNYEDITGMFELLNILSYHQLRDGNFKLANTCELPISGSENRAFGINKNVPIRGTLETIGQQSFFYIKLIPEFPFPQSIHKITEHSMLVIDANSVMIRFPVGHDVLKHFFSDPENYYYLPEEDTAIHRSIGEFVDPAHRKKAVKKNCYIKKECDYIVIPEKSDCFCLKKDYQEKNTYLEIFPESENQLITFLLTYFKLFFK